MGTQLSKIRVGMLVFAAALIVSLVGSTFGAAPTASAAVRTKCSSTSPSYKEWQNTITYGLANSFCIKDTHNGWLVWQSDGNLVWYVHGVAKWASNTNDRGKTFRLQNDGNMVIYDSSGKAVWASSWIKNASGEYWWHDQLRATGKCKFYVSAWYYNSRHYIDQGIGCGNSGAQFWQKQSFEGV